MEYFSVDRRNVDVFFFGVRGFLESRFFCVVLGCWFRITGCLTVLGIRGLFGKGYEDEFNFRVYF